MDRDRRPHVVSDPDRQHKDPVVHAEQPKTVEVKPTEPHYPAEADNPSARMAPAEVRSPEDRMQQHLMEIQNTALTMPSSEALGQILTLVAQILSLVLQHRQVREEAEAQARMSMGDASDV